jgi:hypothetical protein
MVSRRIRDEAAKHNWFGVAVELAIVIIGVFLGLQANNWNIARSESAEARQYRAQIVSSLRANETDMLARAAYYRQVRTHALAALAALESSPPRTDESFLVDAYLATNTNRRPLERSAYDEMISSGVGRDRIGLQTRSEMAAYYAQIPQFNENVLSITEYKDTLRSAMTYSVQKRIAEECRDVVRTLPTGVQIVSMPAECHADLEPKAAAGAIARLKGTPALDRDLTRQLADLDQKLVLFKRYARLAHDLRSKLEAAGA